MAWRQIGSQFSLAARTGKCTVCGTDQKAAESGVLTTDVFITGEGDIEICGQCIKEAADLLGWVDGERASEALAAVYVELQEQTDYSHEAYEEATRLQSTVGGLAAALAKTAAERDELKAAQCLPS
jgi:hypothetical protein